jgi:hypothetical protein
LGLIRWQRCRLGRSRLSCGARGIKGVRGGLARGILCRGIQVDRSGLLIEIHDRLSRTNHVTAK